MPRPHPRHQRGLSLLEERSGDVWDWAPPGWHWEVLPSDARSLLGIPGPAADPDHIWWASRGPLSVQRWWELAPVEVVLSTYQGGGPARPSLRDVVGDRVYQYMVFSSEGSVSRQI